MKEKLKKMTIAELQARQAELQGIGANPENRTAEELENLAEERDAIDAELNERRSQAAAEKLRRNAVAGGTAPVTVLESRGNGAETEQRTFGADSPEYRNAWLKNMATRNGVYLLGEPTEVEQRAYTHTTANTGAVVPTETMNRIVELVESTYPMYADATKSNMVSGFRLPRHSAIAAGDAAATNEAAANSDEQDTFTYLALDGVEIKKTIVISRKMKWQSIQAFEDWIVTHIAERIGVAKETQILTRLDDTDYGIAAANKQTNVACDDAGVRGLFALLKGQGAKVVYANSYTIWNMLAGVDTTAGDKAFIPSPMVDPVVQGRIYGAEVKLDDNLSNKVAYIGIPKYLLANDFEELYMNKAIDPKTLEEIVTGYSLFDAGLEHPLSWVKVTFQ